jgi:hypothetical protein
MAAQSGKKFTFELHCGACSALQQHQPPAAQGMLSLQTFWLKLLIRIPAIRLHKAIN